jgi:hypothetical protein
MDAQERTSSRRSWLARFAVAALVVMLVLGLWQGYGTWLLGRAVAHAG